MSALDQQAVRTRFSALADWKFIVCLLFLALAIRLDFLLANNFVIDSDEAIVGLMAKHISEFKTWPIFYYGQHYLGSLESSVAAIFFWILGPSVVALKLVPLVFSLWLIYLVYVLGLELGSRALARVAAALIAIPPQMLVIWSSMARGGFIELVCIGCLSLLYFVRWLKSTQVDYKNTAIIGFLLGLGWWVNNQIVYFALPIGFLMLLSLLRPTTHTVDYTLGAIIKRFKPLYICGITFFIGGLPYWIFNFQNNFASFGIVQRASVKQALQFAQGFLSTAMPILLGARRQWYDQELFLGSTKLIWFVTLVLLGLVILQRRRELVGLCLCKVNRGCQLEIFILILLTAFIIFSASSFGFLVLSPRYLLPLYIPFAILFAAGICRIATLSQRLAVGIFLFMIGLNLASCYLGGRALPGEPEVFKSQRVSKDHAELINWLNDNKVSFVRTNYWIGYRLAFETKERVRFSQFREPYSVRIPEYEKLANLLGKEYLPLLLIPSQAKLVARALKVQGVQYKEQSLSGYTLLYDLKPVETHLVPLKADLIVTASDNSEVAKFVSDGNLETRWGSGRAQTPGMQLTIKLTTPALLRGISYDLGRWLHDEPVELNIELELLNGKREKLLDKFEYYAVKYYRDRSSNMLFIFPKQAVRKVILTQTGTQKIFDWSVAEVQLFE